MGTLFYDGQVIAHFDDRALAHLQMVILTKLRRHESFLFTAANNDGAGRTSVFVHPGVSLKFTYDDSQAPRLNPSWIGVLGRLANTGPGLHLAPEPQAGAPSHGTGPFPDGTPRALRGDDVDELPNSR